MTRWAPKPLMDRVWEKVDRRAPDECWPWTASTKPDGYGQVTDAGKTLYPHRLVYADVHGPVPEGKTLDHACHTRAVARGECQDGPTCPHRRCCNPAHLEPVTHRQNVQRGLAAHRPPRATCDKGHTLTGPGRCRQCSRDRQARYRERVRANA